MAVELRITMKDSERKLTKDFVIYDIMTFTDTDPLIANALNEVKQEFKGEPEDIKIYATMVLR